MVDRITSNLAREAILAALRDQTREAGSVRQEASELFQSALESTGGRQTPAEVAKSGEAQPSESAGAVEKLQQAVLQVDSEVRAAEPDQLARDVLSGEITEFHEVATRINRARISFEFALEIRNKLIDAYRETMRMTV